MLVCSSQAWAVIPEPLTCIKVFSSSKTHSQRETCNLSAGVPLSRQKRVLLI